MKILASTREEFDKINDEINNLNPLVIKGLDIVEKNISYINCTMKNDFNSEQTIYVPKSIIEIIYETNSICIIHDKFIFRFESDKLYSLKIHIKFID